MSTRVSLTFTTTVWVIDRVHRRTSSLRSNTSMSTSTSLTNNFVTDLFVTDSTDSCKTFTKNISHFRWRKSKRYIFTISTHDLCISTSWTCHLTTMTRAHFNVMYQCTNRDRLKFHCVTSLNIKSCFCWHDFSTYF